MSAATSDVRLDHVIILVPYEWLSSPPDWLLSNFVVSPGGRHADEKTENRLIFLRDGSYIELIAFINDDEARRQGHWWDKPYGVVDWCLTTRSSEFQWQALNAELAKTQSKVRYEAPRAGGRTRPDGVDVQWLVTFPAETERGLVPFFCHDKTPRHHRTPLTGANTAHPCGAVGVSALTVHSSEHSSMSARSVLSAITHQPESEQYRISHFLPVNDSSDPIITFGTADTLHITLHLQLAHGHTVPRRENEDPLDNLIDVVFEAYSSN